MGFLPSCDCVNTTIRMHHIDANKTRREKAKCELQENSMCYFEQIQEVTPTPNSCCAATKLLSQKTCKNEQDMWGTAEEVRTNL